MRHHAVRFRQPFLRRADELPETRPETQDQRKRPHTRHPPPVATFFRIYSPETIPELTRRGLIPDLPMWGIPHGGRLSQLVEELNDLMGGDDFSPDLLDHMAEALIVESLLTRPVGDADRYEEKIRVIALRMRQYPERDYDFQDLANEFTMSHTVLRRYFRRYFGKPPGGYLLQCRINRARRLLAETDTPIAELAVQAGFEDPYYFSRRFKLSTGETASAYRHRYRLHR